MVISTIYAINPNHHSEFIHPEFTAVYGHNSALQNAALAFGTIVSGFLVIQFGVREVYVGLAVVMFLLAVTAISLINTKA
jgi:hypothetical protein